MCGSVGQSLQYARLFLNLQHLKIPIPNPDGELDQLNAADPQMVPQLPHKSFYLITAEGEGEGLTVRVRVKG